MRLRVSSIDSSINKTVLQELFEEFGEVASVKIFRGLNDTAPSLGFVEMMREKEALLAVNGLNGKKIGETILSVEFSNDTLRNHSRAHQASLDEDEDDEDIDEIDEPDSDFDDDLEDDGEERNEIKEVPLDELPEDY